MTDRKDRDAMRDADPELQLLALLTLQMDSDAWEALVDHLGPDEAVLHIRDVYLDVKAKVRTTA